MARELATRTPIAFLIVTLGVVAPASAPAQSGVSDQAMLDSLRSPKPAMRAEAFYALSDRRLVTSRIGAQLHDLLRRENAYFFSPTNGPTSEGYSEYYAEVIGACYRYCNRSDPAVNQTIADGSYNTDSPLILELVAEKGPDILPRLFELAVTKDGFIWSDYRRQTGVTMLGLVAEKNSKITPADRQRIRAAALGAIGDTSLIVRRAGITTLGEVGTPSDTALLARIASSDPDQRSFRGATTYPTRERATAAIQRINARTRQP